MVYLDTILKVPNNSFSYLKLRFFFSAQFSQYLQSLKYDGIVAIEYGEGRHYGEQDKGHITIVVFDRTKVNLLSTFNPAQSSKIENNEYGGIDLTPANMNLQTQNAGEGIKFHLDPAQLAQLQNAPGFTPVIINIQPMGDLREFLGLNDSSAVESG